MKIHIIKKEIRIIKWADKSEHYLDFGEEAYLAYISMNPDFDTHLLRYGYTSLTTPNSTYDYDMNTREKTLLKREETARILSFFMAMVLMERVWSQHSALCD
jgi:protease II